MAEECADALVEFGTDDVLEFAGVRVGFGIGDRECVGQKPLRKAPTTDDIARTVFAVRREREFAPTQFK
jgi:hypothetical protein